MRLLLTGTALLVAVVVAPAEAATRHVSPSGNDTANTCTNAAAPCRTIAHALAQGGTDVIRIARGTYLESVAITSSVDKTLTGGWSPDFTTQNAAKFRTVLTGPTDRVFRLEADTGVEIRFRLESLTITKSEATSDAGFLSVSGGGLAAVASGGGEIFLRLTDVAMTKNEAEGGGALALGALDDGSTIDAFVENSRFEGNRVDGLGGGAIRTAEERGGKVDLNVTDTLFKGNKDDHSGGGAVRTDVDGSGTHFHVYQRSTFLKNSTGSGGGGAIAVSVLASTFTLRIVNSVFLANKAGIGGAIDVFSNTSDVNPPAAATLDVRHATFVGNRAKERGGALRGRASGDSTAALTVEVIQSILWGNKASKADGSGQDVFLEEVSGASTSGHFNRNNVGDVFTGPGVFFENHNDVDVDPKIKKKDGRLKAGSPMIDQFACDVGVVDDIDGDSRPQGALCDIGADEFWP